MRFIIGKKRPEIKVNGAVYRSFGGINTIVYIAKPKGNVTVEEMYRRIKARDKNKYADITPLGTIQGISYEDDIDRKKAPYISGSMISTIFDRSIAPKISGIFDLYVIAQNEYGICGGMKIHKMKPITISSGISSDDIIFEEQITYIADSMIHWTPLSKDKDMVRSPYIQSLSPSATERSSVGF